jgi:hypothetical protein
MLPRLAWNSQSSCFSLPMQGITDLNQCALLFFFFFFIFKVYSTYTFEIIKAKRTPSLLTQLIYVIHVLYVCTNVYVGINTHAHIHILNAVYPCSGRN